MTDPAETRLREWFGLFDENHNLQRDPAAHQSAKMTTIRRLETNGRPICLTGAKDSNGATPAARYSRSGRPENVNALFREMQGSEDACSIEIKVRRQLKTISGLIGRTSGDERRALEKAREELLRLMEFVADSQSPDLRS